ncbi:hypothetical protein [Jannaschia pohangensis]|uniref:Secreted protein n=1 Tax=Jannaschia pohangensis TaxID=390807 RepID=A0A1I3TT52_9RHOB|nr:hypothetical protein [Jannaschia pohangensis]SFJ74444.1 hypothetical protein SAMN04488095_3536 [Jannaschia pohangensis]
MTPFKTAATLTTGLFLALTAPAMAQTMKIDDDGWSLNSPSESSGAPVSIDDDGWSLDDKSEVQGLNERVGTPGDCTALETSAGLAGEACGQMTRGELIRMLDG